MDIQTVSVCLLSVYLVSVVSLILYTAVCISGQYISIYSNVSPVECNPYTCNLFFTKYYMLRASWQNSLKLQVLTFNHDWSYKTYELDFR